MFYCDSTIFFNPARGLGESYYLLCPVCGNSGIRVIRWEDGASDEGECVICKRMEELMDLSAFIGN